MYSNPKFKKVKQKRFKENSTKTISVLVPLGRTLNTYDNYLGRSNTTSKKMRPVVVIENNSRNELAVVPLSSRDGSNRTNLKR